DKEHATGRPQSLAGFHLALAAAGRTPTSGRASAPKRYAADGSFPAWVGALLPIRSPRPRRRVLCGPSSIGPTHRLLRAIPALPILRLARQACEHRTSIALLSLSNKARHFSCYPKQSDPNSARDWLESDLPID